MGDRPEGNPSTPPRSNNDGATAAAAAAYGLDIVVAAKRNAQQTADYIHTQDTAVSHWFSHNSADFNSIFRRLEDTPPNQVADVEQAYAAKYGHVDPKTGKPTGSMLDDLQSHMTEEQFQRVTRLLDEKTKNDVPENQRVDGSTLITDTANLHVGMNRNLKTPDGRSYDLYIPQNARQETGPDGKKGIPLTLAMHGVEPDANNPDLMERESGLNVEADRKGVAIAYLRPEYHEKSALFGLVKKDVGAWNMQGTVGFEPNDPKYDDAKYVDDVIKQVTGRLQVDRSHMGIIGMSDGGRFAEDYAATHPGVFSSVVSFEGTRMAGDPVTPQGPENVMLVHGLNDHTLPWDQTGGWSEGILSVVASPLVANVDKSRPAAQVAPWLAADGVPSANIPTTAQWQSVNDSNDSGPTPSSDDGVTRRYNFQGSGGDVQVNLVRGGEHAIDDYKNLGGMTLGEPTYLDFSDEAIDFILSHPRK